MIAASFSTCVMNWDEDVAIFMTRCNFLTFQMTEICISDFLDNILFLLRCNMKSSIRNKKFVYYKKFFCDKHNISPQLVETYFGLLKRTAKKDKVEIFRVSSGEIKIKNALNILTKAVYNIHNNNHPKNRTKCAKCEFKNTQYCV